MPAKSAATSLIARLKGRGGGAASTLVFLFCVSVITPVVLPVPKYLTSVNDVKKCRIAVKADIVMPVKAEAEPVIASVMVSEPVALASSEMLTEEENDALDQISQRCVLLRPSAANHGRFVF